MRTKLLFTAIALAGCMAAMAQSNRFSAGLELAMPMGDYADQAGFGFGATLGFELPVGDNLGLFLNAGYLMFSPTEEETPYAFGTINLERNSSAVPAHLGAKYYLVENQDGIYILLMAGIHAFNSTTSITQSIQLLGQTFTSEQEETRSDINLSIAPGLGIMIGESFDLSLRYHLIFGETTTINPIVINSATNQSPLIKTTATLSYLGLRAAYMFGSR